MKSYESVAAWAEDQPEAFQPAIRSLRKLIKKEFPKLIETVKWGNACWVLNDLPIIYLYADKKSFQVGFFAGSMLKDPAGVLQGKGKFVRFIPAKKRKDIPTDVLINLIKQAIKIKYK